MKYTRSDLEKIIENCCNIEELIAVCEIVKYLFFEGIISTDYLRFTKKIANQKVRSL